MAPIQPQRQEEWTQRDMEHMINSVESRGPVDDWKETCDRIRHRKIANVQRLQVEHQIKLRENVWQPIVCGSDVRCIDTQASAIAEATIARMSDQVGKAIEGFNEVADAQILLGQLHYS